MSSQKPTLPSIQIMLEGIGINNVNTTITNTEKNGHQRQLSDVNNNSLGLTSYLENLSLSTPKPIEPMTTWSSSTSSPSSSPTSHHLNHPIRPTPLYQYPYHHHRSARNLHSRSYSDYTHPYMTSPPSSSSLLSSTNTTNTSSSSISSNDNNNPNNKKNHIDINDHLLPKTTTHSYLGTFHQQHRRAISTSTLDTIMQHTLYKSSSSSSLDHHYSPPPSLRSSHSTTTSIPLSPTLSIQTPSSITDEHHHYFDTDEDNDDHSYHENKCNIKQQKENNEDQIQLMNNDNNNNNNNKSTNNKYQCPYCQKGFSRPSSLRIHTYSHTGEKPFECPEEGCSRKFSVQSNMRRHLRVHRMGRHLKLKRSPPSIKPLAAKPSWMTENNDY